MSLAEPGSREIERFVRGVMTQASGDGASSLDQMLPLVYAEFRGLADVLLRRERAGHTLRPTALAHEAYIRLARETRSQITDPRHLLAVAATTMRRVLIDYARERKALRRGGADAVRVSLGESLLDARAAAVEFTDLNDSLERLGKEDPRKLQVVELLYFAGYTFEEAAEILDVSVRTITRDWTFAKAWLWRELVGERRGPD